jgi:hypothetical protein
MREEFDKLRINKPFMKKLLLPLAACFTLFISCKKENQCQCGELKEAALSGDVNTARASVESVIATLKNKTYNQANIGSLNQKLTSNCEVLAEMFCYDCVKTNPSQTEIRITVQSGTNRVEKIIDLSYNVSNQIVFVNMH